MIGFNYTNHRGECDYRNVKPLRLWYGSTVYHSGEQWLLDAEDLDKEAPRTFAVRNIKGLGPLLVAVLDAQRAALAVKDAALEPFGVYASRYVPTWGDGAQIADSYGEPTITLGDCRRAAEARKVQP